MSDLHLTGCAPKIAVCLQDWEEPSICVPGSLSGRYAGSSVAQDVHAHAKLPYIAVLSSEPIKAGNGMATHLHLNVLAFCKLLYKNEPVTVTSCACRACIIIDAMLPYMPG